MSKFNRSDYRSGAKRPGTKGFGTKTLRPRDEETLAADLEAQDALVEKFSTPPNELPVEAQPEAEAEDGTVEGQGATELLSDEDKAQVEAFDEILNAEENLTDLGEQEAAAVDEQNPGAIGSEASPVGYGS